MGTKLGRMITSLDGILPIMSHDPLITWPCEIRGSLTGAGSARKRLCRHRFLVFLKHLSFKLMKNVVISKCLLGYIQKMAGNRRKGPLKRKACNVSCKQEPNLLQVL